MPRDHSITTSRSGLITVAGGKWTTYRQMGEDTIDAAEKIAGFAPRIHQEAAQLQSIMSLVAAGLGIALVPSSIQHLNHPEIAFRRLRDRCGCRRGLFLSLFSRTAA